MVQKIVHVYHYEDAVGELLKDWLNGVDFSAVYRPISHKTITGQISEQIVTERPDLVFLCLNFSPPSFDAGVLNRGLDELVKIREKSQVPVVIVTGGGTVHREDAFNKGASEYLEVPTTGDYIVELAKRLTSQPQS